MAARLALSWLRGECRTSVGCFDGAVAVGVLEEGYGWDTGEEEPRIREGERGEGEDTSDMCREHDYSRVCVALALTRVYFE